MCANCTCLLLIKRADSKSVYVFICACAPLFVQAGGDVFDLFCFRVKAVSCFAPVSSFLPFIFFPTTGRNDSLSARRATARYANDV